jgi:hypothetical protein
MIAEMSLPKPAENAKRRATPLIRYANAQFDAFYKGSSRDMWKTDRSHGTDVSATSDGDHYHIWI